MYSFKPFNSIPQTPRRMKLHVPNIASKALCDLSPLPCLYLLEGPQCTSYSALWSQWPSPGFTMHAPSLLRSFGDAALCLDYFSLHPPNKLTTTHPLGLSSSHLLEELSQSCSLYYILRALISLLQNTYCCSHFLFTFVQLFNEWMSY